MNSFIMAIDTQDLYGDIISGKDITNSFLDEAPINDINTGSIMGHVKNLISQGVDSQQTFPIAKIFKKRIIFTS